jgi:hypothetical protein
MVVAATASGSTPVFLTLLDTSNNFNYSGDGTSGVCLWGAQFETGAFPTSYIPSTDSFTSRASTATYFDSNGVLQTAGSGVARSNAYGYDTSGALKPIGLLLEAGATNLLLRSEEFDNAAWGKTGATI